MSSSLKGHIAVITGASKGLGRSMAEALASNGAAVALVARNQELLEEVAEGISTAGGKAEVVVADVTDEAAVVEVQRTVEESLGVCGHPDQQRRHQQP